MKKTRIGSVSSFGSNVQHEMTSRGVMLSFTGACCAQKSSRKVVLSKQHPTRGGSLVATIQFGCVSCRSAAEVELVLDQVQLADKLVKCHGVFAERAQFELVIPADQALPDN
jgi:hypothetical protein